MLRIPNGPGPDNCSGDSLRPPFLSILVNQISELALPAPIYDFCGSESLVRIHAHIQRPLCLPTKTPLGGVNLHLGKSNVSQDAVHLRYAEPAEQRVQLREILVHQLQP